MSGDLKTLREAVAEDVRFLGKRIEERVINERVSAKLQARVEAFKSAWDVLEKVGRERNKIRPDVPAVLDENSNEIIPAGWTQKNLKLRNDLGEKFNQLQKQMILVSDLQLADDPDGQKIEEAYTKLAEITQKVSKGTKDTSDDAQSDAS